MTLACICSHCCALLMVAVCCLNCLAMFSLCRAVRDTESLEHIGFIEGKDPLGVDVLLGDLLRPR